jgi:hypothetical protein
MALAARALRPRRPTSSKRPRSRSPGSGKRTIRVAGIHSPRGPASCGSPRCWCPTHASPSRRTCSCRRFQRVPFAWRRPSSSPRRLERCAPAWSSRATATPRSHSKRRRRASRWRCMWMTQCSNGTSCRGEAPCAPGGLCTFAVASGTGEFVALKSSFQAKPGRWIGTKVGLFAFALEPGASEGHADFDYFRFSAP